MKMYFSGRLDMMWLLSKRVHNDNCEASSARLDDHRRPHALGTAPVPANLAGQLCWPLSGSF